MNGILAVIIGQLGFAFDGVTLHIRVMAPGNRANTKPYQSEKERRKVLQRELRARKQETRP